MGREKERRRVRSRREEWKGEKEVEGKGNEGENGMGGKENGCASSFSQGSVLWPVNVITVCKHVINTVVMAVPQLNGG